MLVRTVYVAMDIIHAGKDIVHACKDTVHAGTCLQGISVIRRSLQDTLRCELKRHSTCWYVCTQHQGEMAYGIAACPFLQVMVNVPGCRLTYEGQAETSA